MKTSDFVLCIGCDIMIMDFNKLIGKHVKILAVFSDMNKVPIFYEAVILEYDSVGKMVLILDKYQRKIYLDTTSIRQVMIV